MTSSNRATRIAKIFKVLKKHYKPVPSPSDRTMLEHLLYACCLENARFDAADETFAKLQQSYFDWNEVRVSTVAELAETMSALPDSNKAASRLKRSLQAVFETYYSFDIDGLKKQNIGKAAKDLERHDGMTSYAVAYVTQHGLGGHAIPTNQGALHSLVILDVITPKDASNGHAPGLERAISKNKGIEFASLLHQFGADFYASPYSPRVRAVFTEIDPDCKSRLPKRGAKREEKHEKDESATNRSGKRGAEGRASDPRKKGGARKTSRTSDSQRPASTQSSSSKKKSGTKRITKKKPR